MQFPSEGNCFAGGHFWIVFENFDFQKETTQFLKVKTFDFFKDFLQKQFSLQTYYKVEKSEN